jgi:tyrosyl-DNA phosphodiesterase 1
MSLLDRPISPPAPKRPLDQTGEESEYRNKVARVGQEDGAAIEANDDIRIVRSPIRLYTVKDLPDSENVDTITIRDVLSPTSTLDEIWSFNMMTNMQFIRNAIGVVDENRVKVRIIHGYWQENNESRKVMEEGAWGSNVRLISAYLHDPFGTHHSKIIVMFRMDDTAQVAIQTGISPCNMFLFS